jgi:hypothetical protein
MRKGDPARAVQILREGAEKGDVDSQKLLAAILESGVAAKEGPGVAANPREALMWYEKAAQSGDNEALKRMGILYAVGRGTPRDADKAFEMFQRAGVDVASHLKGATSNSGKTLSRSTMAWITAFSVDLTGRVSRYPRDAVRRGESGTVVLHIHAATRAVELAGGTAPDSLKSLVRETAGRGLLLLPPPDEAAEQDVKAEFVIDYRLTN